MVKYFGITGTTGLGWYTNTNRTYFTQSYSCVCPGTGAQNLVSLGAYVKGAGGTSYHRVAIYTAAGVFIAQGSAAITVLAAATEAWVEHTSFVDGEGDPVSPQLTAVTAYILAWTKSTGYGSNAYTSGSSGDTGRIDSEYTAGFPASVPSLTATSNLYLVRAGVEAADSGLSIPVAMASYRRRRM